VWKVQALVIRFLLFSYYNHMPVNLICPYFLFAQFISLHVIVLDYFG
jgi:hypothetical protein